KPESAHYLPMLAKRDSSGTTRSLSVYFSDDAVRRDADTLSYFIARAADDPMLSIRPNVRASGARPFYIPGAWEDVFPKLRSSVTPVRKLEDLPAIRGDKDG